MLKTRQGVPPRASRQESRPEYVCMHMHVSESSTPDATLHAHKPQEVPAVASHEQYYIRGAQRPAHLFRDGPFGLPCGLQVARAGEAVILEADMLVALLGGVGQVLAHLECVLPPLLHTRRCLSRGHVYARRHEPLA